MVRGLLGFIAVVLVAMAAYGVVSFVSETQQLGGAALDGYVQDGHYYVGNHGRYSEVTAEQWELSRAHGLRMFVMQPVALLALGFLVFGVLVPFLVGRESPDAPARLRDVVGSGPMAASARCRGRIGSANLPVRVTVHPGGIVVRPLWLRERAIPSREITAARLREGTFVSGVEIEHQGVDVASPILLRLDATSPAAGAILRLRGGA